jgi:hypothetical protein
MCRKPVAMNTPHRLAGHAELALILCCLLFPMALGPELHWPWSLRLMLLAIIPLLLWMRASALRKERAATPAAAAALLQLASIRFGMAIALLFFSAWSGFMFCMALTMQAGLAWRRGSPATALSPSAWPILFRRCMRRG